MKITCDNCGAVYRIPEEKLTKDVSRATCKKCGSKLIIRRPAEGQEGYEDPRLGGMQGGDDDSVINHEERTVIAVVPELQRFDAVPPLAGGPGSPQDVLGMLSSASAGGNSPVVAKTTSDTTIAEEPRKIGSASNQKASQPAAKPANSSPMVGPGITATTSPLRPSGEAPPPPPPPPRVTQSPMQASVPTPAPNRPDVVQMFANQTNKPAAAPEFQQPASRLSLVLLAVALVGVLLFIDKGLWGLTRMTAVGFILAVYGIIAAFLAQWDLTRTGKINFVKVFLVPAAVCAVLIAALWSAQKDEVAFLHQDWKIEMVKVTILDHLQAPDAEKETSLATRLASMAAGGGKYARRTPRANTNPGLPNPDELPEIGNSKPGDTGAGEAPGLKTGTDTGVPEGTIGGSGIVPGHVKHTVAALPTGSKAEVQLDEPGINSSLEKARVRTCFTTSAGGLTLPGRVELRIRMAPDGTPKDAQIIGEDQLRGTTLERCMHDKVMKIHFPSFEAATTQSYDATFVL